MFQEYRRSRGSQEYSAGYRGYQVANEGNVTRRRICGAKGRALEAQRCFSGQAWRGPCESRLLFADMFQRPIVQFYHLSAAVRAAESFEHKNATRAGD
jgi:hypothetical protein